MKTRFPKLQGFLIKPEKNSKKLEKKGLNVTTAFVHCGHIVATDGKILLFFNLKEFLKNTVTFDKDEEPATAYALISQICEHLEGRTLSREFFAEFSKLQTITKVDEFKLYVEKNGLHFEYSLEEKFDVELLADFLGKQKNVWTKVRSEQSAFCILGGVLSSLNSVLSSEISNDSLIFERTADDKARFCLANKDFIFGIVSFSVQGESSITKFSEADDYFELHL